MQASVRLSMWRRQIILVIMLIDDEFKVKFPCQRSCQSLSCVTEKKTKNKTQLNSHRKIILFVSDSHLNGLHSTEMVPSLLFAFDDI